MSLNATDLGRFSVGFELSAGGYADVDVDVDIPGRYMDAKGDM